METVSIQKVCSILCEHDDFLIFTHQKPDGDTVGSAFALMFALRSMGKRADVFDGGDIPQKYDYFTQYEKIGITPQNATLVAVDIAASGMLSDKAKEYKDDFYLSIDHHAFSTPFAKYNYENSNAAANCENIYEIINALNLDITTPVANALYTGIATDTGCFMYSNTSPLTHLIAAELIGKGIDFAEINRKMFECKQKNRIELEKAAWQTLEISHGGLIATVAVTREMFEKAGANDDDFEGLTSISRSVDGIKIGLTVRENENGDFKCSLRSYPPIDSTVIAASFGGGGHIRAAGCTINGTLETVKKQLLDRCEQELKKQGLL
ncbi:MAG: bifunctional oligoribonuclease/PAP phosphatase NrnA [Oscillospiraceae bacterium]|nr:bifunctional oligoribonuclease/PAP phosphatase NrnA [Candidatus Equicaccousia limihippi]